MAHERSPYKVPKTASIQPYVVEVTPFASSYVSLDENEKLDQHEQEWKPQKAEWMVILTMSVTSLIVALDSTILVPVLPTLASSLHGTAQEAFWAGTSYLLSNAVFQPVLAALSDIFGRREVLVPSILAFLVGSIICGWAQSFAMLLVGRVIQGVGGAGIMTMAQMVFADLVPLRQRPKYFALVLATWGLGTVIGPLLGGVFVQKTSWRWCFWLNLPICAVALIMVLLFVNLTMPKTSLKEKLMRVDWLGGFIFISSMTSFLIAVSWGGVQYSWSSWRTRLPLGFGVIGLMVTLIWERYYALEPFLNKALFQSSSAIFSYFCAMFQGVAVFIALYYLPFYFTAVRDASPVHSGVNILPACLCLLPGSAIVSALITRLGHYRVFIWIGWAVGTLGAGLFVLFNQSTHTAVWASALSIFGIGMGMVLSSVNFSVQASVEPKDAGRAAAMYAFMRNVGMSLGVAIGGSTFQNYMKHELLAQDLPVSIALNAEGFVHQLWDRTATNEALAKRILAAYVHGFRGVFEVLTAISGVALLLALFIKHFNMDRMLESKFSLERQRT